MSSFGTSGDVFCEYLVKRKQGSVDLIIKIAAIIIAIAFTGIVFVLAPVFLLLPVVLWVVVYFLIKMLKMEYEYSFTSGDLDIDSLRGDFKRKRVISIDMNKVEMVAPEGSHELDSLMRGNYQLKDFSANDSSQKNYYIFASVNEQNVKVLFTPNENMIEHMHNYAPRKVKNY